MQREKSLTITAPILEFRDSDIWELINDPSTKVAAAIREGLRLLIAQRKKKDEFEAEVLKELAEIKDMIQIHGGQIPLPEKQEYNDPFLDSDL